MWFGVWVEEDWVVGLEYFVYVVEYVVEFFGSGIIEDWYYMGVISL